MTWLPKSVVCLSYYDRFRFRSDALAALFLSLQIFPLAIAIALLPEYLRCMEFPVLPSRGF
ncbi:MAG: hypothetical protein LAO24_22930 [Acidobacteriia bacterium]|nr:hypothetical protein [Terriglobia bacterium]